ncbi:gluconokinase [Herbiconiux liukaitaii]|uniref:gluconokinase n=1 Tax=Herbiconiux liukaitaii TaxID=3342799 RepID=UPI0035BB6874
MTSLPCLVVMGVSGAGKSTVGAELADALGVPFVDADDLHPLTNVEKMRAGVALDDDDRWPWLDAVGQAIAAAETTGVVVACSALRASYREAIRVRAPHARFVMLHADRDLLLQRLRSRAGHFMPASLLDSQLATLEPLGPSEHGITVDAASAPEVITAEVAAYVDSTPTPTP